ncbi:Uncharacterized protein ToN1_07620 [Aromatoleum petrolei]|nr:Uncharacterized protein ToN1_07620 [Aromatoleum petrolei]
MRFAKKSAQPWSIGREDAVEEDHGCAETAVAAVKDPQELRGEGDGTAIGMGYGAEVVPARWGPARKVTVAA